MPRIHFKPSVCNRDMKKALRRDVSIERGVEIFSRTPVERQLLAKTGVSDILPSLEIQQRDLDLGQRFIVGDYNMQ